MPDTTPKWYVYILESEPTGRLYTGISVDIERRIKQHNGKKGARYTRTGRPWILAYQEGPLTQSEALKRERAIKRLTRAAKLNLIHQ